MRVLIVEDEMSVGELLQDLVREAGHEPQLVPSAEAALGRLRTARPDLVLLDLRLPGMSGFDFLQLRPVRDSRVPIVVMSGVGTDHDAQVCLQLGAIDFVRKPIPFDRLRQILTCFEPLALAQAVAMTGRGPERRRSPRVRVALPVQVSEYGGVAWTTMSADLSFSGIKVLPRWAAPESAVKLSFTLPGDDEHLEAVSVLLRIDVDGYVFYFVNLTRAQMDRLTQIVGQLTGRQQPLRVSGS